MDLIAGYLLIILILFSANLALFLGNYNFNNIKILAVSLACSAISLIVINASAYINQSFLFLMDSYGLLFLAISIAVFALMLLYTRNSQKNLRYSIYLLSIIFFISTLLIACQSKISLMDSIVYSLFVFIIVFCVYKITRLLIHAKRPYYVIIGEYMSLFSILMFIFALTYNSTRGLDYSMFNPFLILTPTYQVIYMIIAIAIIMVIGVVLNDSKGGNS